MRISILFICFLFAFISFSYAGVIGIRSLELETDHPSYLMLAPFDLRDRESFLQITNVESTNQNIHIQIYNVRNNCNENNFFDNYTPSDTHIYNLRDITTNDGNPSGVDLPDDAFGIVSISAPFPILLGNPDGPLDAPLIGNIRVIDNLGYEYRTNIASGTLLFQFIPQPEQIVNNFNYNSETGIILSDVFGIALTTESFQIPEQGVALTETTLDDVLQTYAAVDVDIYDLNEVPFSCRDVVFSCVDENHPLLEELLELANGELTFARSSASVARYEYGINNAVPNSKGGELLCPGNIISEGTVILTHENSGDETLTFVGYVGLNNGNQRGSFDTMFFPGLFNIQSPP